VCRARGSARRGCASAPLKVGDVHARRQQIDGDYDARLAAVAEPLDGLERSIDAARDLLDEVVALAEHLTERLHELVGVRDLWDVVCGEDEDLREPPGLLFVLVGVLLHFEGDLAVAVG
jgi:hypothetical protein